MKKISSFVLMAVMLLMSANTWADEVNAEVNTTADFNTAWTSATSNGGKIVLTGDVTLSKTLWLGTVAIDGTAHSIEIDLNGNELKSSAAPAFLLTHGNLTISNSKPESGQLTGTGSGNVFYITGSTNKNVDPSQDGVNYFTHLIIKEGVYVVHQYYDAAISIDGIWKGGKAQAALADSKCVPAKPELGYITNVYAGIAEKFPAGKEETNPNKCAAHGVRVDLWGTINGQKYGIKANGYLGSPTYYFENYQKEGDVVAFSSSLLPSGYKIKADDSQYSPFVYVHPGAKIYVLADDPNYETNKGKKNPIGIYAAGYARWKVEGYSEGGVGALVKSGEVDFHNATVVGTGSSYSQATASTSGTTASGSAIVIESTGAYVGDIDVSVSGDSKVTATNGYAIDENVTTTDEETKVDAITITGGTFNGGQVPVDPSNPESATTQATIKITDTTVGSGSNVVTVTGGQVQGTGEDNVNIGGMTLDEFLSGQGTGVDTQIDYVDNGNGTTSMVITTIPGGAEPDEFEDITSVVSNPADPAMVVWKHPGTINTTAMSQSLTTDLTLKKLVINQSYAQTLTVPENKTLTVGRVILGAKAKIIVEPGGQFIVNGTQGITTGSTDNLVLRANATERAVFLLNPAVESNRHPKATVEFVSNSFTDGGNFAKQRFGIPTNGALTSITTKYEGSDVPTALSKFDYVNNKWVDFGWINIAGKDANLDQMNNPFDYYQMQHNTPNMGTVVTMKGELVGSDNPMLSIRGNFWNGFANSYMAPINGEKLISMIPNTVDKAFYLYDLSSEQSTWEPVTLLNPMNEILPMQPFLIRNTKSAANATVNYAKGVYYPTTGEVDPSPAPARSSKLDNITKAKLVVKGEDCIDRLIVAEGEQFTKEFDNGYDAAKYMNDGINMYVTASEKMSIYATDNIENTYVGFQAVKGGAYSIEFKDIEGEELTLIDLETGASIVMNEGAVYTFTADANTTNDYRFKVVRVKKVATDIDSIEAQKRSTGIYTLMGQYVGEMNLWNSLPAGVYVVDGTKRVK